MTPHPADLDPALAHPPARGDASPAATTNVRTSIGARAFDHAPRTITQDEQARLKARR